MWSLRDRRETRSSRENWRGRCTARLFFRRRRLRCASRSEKWPTRCCSPASASFLRFCSASTIRSCSPTFPRLLNKSSRLNELRSPSFRNTQSQLNLEESAAQRVSGNRILDGLPVAHDEINVRLVLPDDRLFEL